MGSYKLENSQLHQTDGWDFVARAHIKVPRLLCLILPVQTNVSVTIPFSSQSGGEAPFMLALLGVWICIEQLLCQLERLSTEVQRPKSRKAT